MAALLATGAADPVETIHIRVHPIGDVCLGNCANYEVVVRSDGLVSTHDFRFDNTADRSRWQFRISRAAYASFKQALAVARPEGEVIDRSACERMGKLESPDWRPDVDEIDIAWDADGKRSRLVTCNMTDEAGRAYVDALRSIGVNNGSGGRMRPERIRP